MKQVGILGLIAVAALLLSACERTPTSDDGKGGSEDNAPATQPADESGVTFDEVKRKTQDALVTATEYARQKTKEIQQRMEPELEALEQKVEQMRERLHDAEERSRPEIRKRVEHLKELARKAREELDHLREAGDEKWEGAKKRYDETMRRLEEALDEGIPSAPPTTRPATRPDHPHEP